MHSAAGSFLNSYFAETVCINLARRTDRWARAQVEFQLHGLTSVRRVEACDGSTARLPDGWDYGAGSYGCLRSHTSVVLEARENGYSSILILEDDVEFHPELDSLFRQYAKQIPADWDALLFGGMHRSPPEQVSPNIVRLKETSSTYAYAIRNTLYDAFLDINRDTMIAVDENNHILQRSFKFYCFMPHLAWVKRDYSDIMDGEVNPWWLRHSFSLFGPEQEKMLRQMGAIVFFDSRRFGNRAEAQPEVELLQCVLRLYIALVEESAICIVERGTRPLLTRADLPERCQYRSFSPDASRAQCAVAAAEALGERQYLVCAPHDVYPLRSELRASLLCTPQYDIVTPLNELLPLNDEDTRKFLRDEVGAVDTALYPSLPADALTTDFCIVAAPLLRQIQASPHQEEILTPSLLERSRVFRTPSRVARLSHSWKAAQATGN